jgi:hypothetical protein
MSDLLACTVAYPHPYHGWDDLPYVRAYHLCPGVPANDVVVRWAEANAAKPPDLITRLRTPLIGSPGPVGERLLAEAADALETARTEGAIEVLEELRTRWTEPEDAPYRLAIKLELRRLRQDSTSRPVRG